MTLTSCSGERPPSRTATRVPLLPAMLYPNSATHAQWAVPTVARTNSPFPSDAPDRTLQPAPHAAQSPHAARSSRTERVRTATVRVRGAEMAVISDIGGGSLPGAPLLVWAH